MNIYSAQEMKEWDTFTLEHENITEIELINRAASRFTLIFKELVNTSDPIIILAGTGNNGADGYAVARNLFHHNYDVTVWDIPISKHRSSSNATLKQNMPSGINIKTVKITDTFPEVSYETTFIDALLGTGINRPMSVELMQLIDTINTLPNHKIALDIPSGMPTEMTIAEIAILSNLCITFQVPKPSFFVAENYYYIPEWIPVDIGLSTTWEINRSPEYHLYNLDDAYFDIPIRERNSHKGDYGHVLICAGSQGMVGAALLAGKAALKTGCGLTTIHAPSCAYHILQSSLPEVMVSTDPNLNCISILPSLKKYNVVAIGPGMGTSIKSKNVLLSLLDTYKGFIIIDADAINILAQIENWKTLLNSKHILLPHSGEFDRLVGSRSQTHLERLHKLKILSSDIDATIVLKGYHTCVAQSREPLSFNSTGNPGMATAGSGDVLTGIIASLTAQLENPYLASQLGVFIHGLAGDIYAEEYVEETLIASDLIQYLSAAFRYIRT